MHGHVVGLATKFNIINQHSACIATFNANQSIRLIPTTQSSPQQTNPFSHYLRIIDENTYVCTYVRTGTSNGLIEHNMDLQRSRTQSSPPQNSKPEYSANPIHTLISSNQKHI